MIPPFVLSPFRRLSQNSLADDAATGARAYVRARGIIGEPLTTSSTCQRRVKTDEKTRRFVRRNGATGRCSYKRARYALHEMIYLQRTIMEILHGANTYRPRRRTVRRHEL